MQLAYVELTPIVIFNLALLVFFTLAFFYQIVYLVVGALRGEVKLPEAKKNHRYAFMIAAHNEEVVISELVSSIKQQEYPAELIDVYVVADACTDATAERARAAGACVYERNDLARKGKSWALDMGFRRVLEEQGRDAYDAFIIFDADNLLSRTYVREMNKVLDIGYLAATSYRNSKNFDSSWISSAYALWFLREARFLNNARMMLGTSCAISGSGWMISNKLVKSMQGWDFHTLTEDIQFSTFCAANGVKIGYAPAEFFDEQPVTFAASWTQRMRWTKGFYEVFFSYAKDLGKGIARGRFDSYDLLMTVAPGMILSLLSVIVNGAYLAVGLISNGYLATQGEIGLCVGSLFMTFISMYLTFFVLALITTVLERKHIHAQHRWRVWTNLVTFPLFMMSYIPITVAALFKKVEWVPTKHEFAMSVDDVVNTEA
jgi:cellulose synthase/poly-beta-1,6-N-acetylglucosamine synthase-like glycosyltransferase